MRRHSGRRQAAAPVGITATARPSRPGLVPWYVRASEVLALARAFAQERREAFLAERLAQRYGGAADDVPPADLERAVDDLLREAGGMGDGRSILRAFAEEAGGLETAERAQVLRWERERGRGVYVLDRCHPDFLEAWDPIEGKRVVVHFTESLGRGRAASLRRGTVVTVVTVPWNERRLAEGRVEMFEDEDALRLFRTEVRNAGHPWHDPPAPPPVPSA
jgi:hypothetical protein